MDKRVILAVAGAGKTYKICNHLDENKSNLIIAFTHRNVRNIIEELVKRFGYVPKYTYIKTFDSFLLSHFIKPYFSLVKLFFKDNNLKFDGVTMKAPHQQSINGHPNPLYIKDSLIGHYLDNNLLYCDRFSKLIVKVKNKNINILDTALEGVNKFYDYLYIDEFQDFRNYDYDVLKQIIKKCNNIILVGDYYQHSVSGTNNHGKPFDGVNYESYIKILEEQNLLVDQTELIKSRRCSKEICNFVSSRLNINIESEEINQGKISFIYDELQLNNILKDDAIIKLVNRNSNSYSFKSLNWSYSKGDTIDGICIILTEDLEDFDKEDFDVKKLSDITRNVIYVAITRSKSDVYFVKKSLFDKIKNNYQLSIKEVNQHININPKLSSNSWQQKTSKNGNNYYEKKYKRELIRVFPSKYGKYSLAKYKENGYYEQKFDTMEAAEEFFIKKTNENK
ncbi:MAG: AAA family ATPase [Bacilli bacterium]